jgi:hypothetical protein
MQCPFSGLRWRYWELVCKLLSLIPHFWLALSISVAFLQPFVNPPPLPSVLTSVLDEYSKFLWNVGLCRLVYMAPNHKITIIVIIITTFKTLNVICIILVCRKYVLLQLHYMSVCMFYKRIDICDIIFICLRLSLLHGPMLILRLMCLLCINYYNHCHGNAVTFKTYWCIFTTIIVITLESTWTAFQFVLVSLWIRRYIDKSEWIDRVLKRYA